MVRHTLHPILSLGSSLTVIVLGYNEIHGWGRRRGHCSVDSSEAPRSTSPVCGSTHGPKVRRLQAVHTKGVHAATTRMFTFLRTCGVCEMIPPHLPAPRPARVATDVRTNQSTSCVLDKPLNVKPDEVTRWGRAVQSYSKSRIRLHRHAPASTFSRSKSTPSRLSSFAHQAALCP